MAFSRITVRQDQMGGVPCIRGLRIPVSVIVDMAADGMSAEEIVALYPDLEGEDVTEALRYAAEVVGRPKTESVTAIIERARRHAGLDEDEAMKLAVEETRAARAERGRR